MLTPTELRYSQDHEWVRVDGNRARIGITDFAQDALGDVVYLDLPAVGTAVTAGEKIGEVESTKTVSEIYAPVGGEIVEVNPDLVDAPERVNADPYGEGWICVIELSSDYNPSDLMDASSYNQMTEA